MKLCAATGCRMLIPNGQARCPKHDESSIRRAAYRTGSYKRIRAWMLANATGCATCGATTDLTVDHIVPLSRGGTNDPLNLQVLCRSCNSRKGGGSDLGAEQRTRTRRFLTETAAASEGAHA